MLKQQEPLVNHEMRTSHLPTHDLPPLPPGVNVPDDLSTLEHRPPRRRLVRWLGWMAVAALGIGTAVLVAVIGDDGTSEPPAYQLVQDEIDQAVANHRTTSRVFVQDAVDEAIAAQRLEDEMVAYYEQRYTAVTEAPSYVLVQEAVDEAVAAQRVEDEMVAYYEQRYLLEQDAIDEAVTEQR